MSKALICDRCHKPFSEQVALKIETEFTFIHTHYDLCPKCHGAFKDEFIKMGRKGEDEHAGKNQTD